MEFSQFRINDFVRWNSDIDRYREVFPAAVAWEEEPLDCILQVVGRSAESIELACVKECGRHSILEVLDEEYEEISKILEQDLLLLEMESDVFQKLFNRPDSKENYSQMEEDYDLDNDKEYIYTLISQDGLPKRQKRQAKTAQ